jgi:hypothetical protein
MEDITLTQLFAQMDRHLARQDEILAEHGRILAKMDERAARQTEILNLMDTRTVVIADAIERTNQYQQRTAQLLLEHEVLLARIGERLTALERR